MSDAEWATLSPARQQALISAGKSSENLPAAPGSTISPMKIQSPKAQALLERIAQGKEHTYALQQLWLSLELCPCAPDARQFQLWFKHEFEVISDSFYETAVWLSKLRQKDPGAAVQRTHDDKIKYASAVMNGLAKANNEATVNRAFGDGAGLPPDWDALDASEKRKLIAIHKREVQQ
jgi:hypothetical protein